MVRREERCNAVATKIPFHLQASDAGPFILFSKAVVCDSKFVFQNSCYCRRRRRRNLLVKDIPRSVFVQDAEEEEEEGRSDSIKGAKENGRGGGGGTRKLKNPATP